MTDVRAPSRALCAPAAASALLLVGRAASIPEGSDLHPHKLLRGQRGRVLNFCPMANAVARQDRWTVWTARVDRGAAAKREIYVRCMSVLIGTKSEACD